MLIGRIENCFDTMDTAYSDLYECQLSFEKELSRQNQEKLLKALKGFKLSLKKYEAAVKTLYINKKIGDLNEIIRDN